MNGTRTPVASVGIVCFRDSEVLLIRRGKAPLQGAWTLPGGRIEWGEPAATAALRELREETGVEAELAGFVELVDGVFANSAGEVWGHYLIAEYAARWISGEPVAGDDAADARFVDADKLDEYGVTAEAQRIIAAARRSLFRAAPA